MQKKLRKTMRKEMRRALDGSYEKIRLRMVHEICAMKFHRRLKFAWMVITKRFKQPPTNKSS